VQAARVVVTAAEAHWSHWQRVLWFTRPEHRYVSIQIGDRRRRFQLGKLWIYKRCDTVYEALRLGPSKIREHDDGEVIGAIAGNIGTEEPRQAKAI
jgi:hypothetical protein